MAEFDRLPPDLRAWIAQAALPWSPHSVARAHARALGACRGDKTAALTYLETLQRRRVATDAARTWGPGHPATDPPAQEQRHDADFLA